jgi:hypothetical protein
LLPNNLQKKYFFGPKNILYTKLINYLLNIWLWVKKRIIHKSYYYAQWSNICRMLHQSAQGLIHRIIVDRVLTRNTEPKWSPHLHQVSCFLCEDFQRARFWATGVLYKLSLNLPLIVIRISDVDKFIRQVNRRSHTFYKISYLL